MSRAYIVGALLVAVVAASLGATIYTGADPAPGGDSYTSTRRVDLSLQDAATVDGNDGWITIVTTVESDGETITVRESRQVP